MSPPSQPASFFVHDIPVCGDVVLSPMDGYSDLPFRLICRRLGSAMSYTEFVNVDEWQHGVGRAQRKLEFDPAERPIAFQIYGHDEDRLVETALRLADREPAPSLIDINMGCYVRSISERGAGSGMLRYPDRIERVFARLSKALPIPVTGKIRLGWDEASRNHVEVARILEANGAALIAVHARTRAQGYKGDADWDAIAEVKAAVGIPVLGNGDVRRVADIARMKRHTGCDGVMIGRGAIGNPWVFAGKDREQVTFEEKVALVRQHLGLNLRFYGPSHGLILFRKHAAKYIQDAPGEPEIRVPLLTCESVEAFDALLNAKDEGRRMKDEVPSPLHPAKRSLILHP